ncbi:hypothetical protein J132_04040 [Termitomyces sp. J132]|nr:hypothetical protein J132_04040 [Termitomyces sp. J132]
MPLPPLSLASPGSAPPTPTSTSPASPSTLTEIVQPTLDQFPLAVAHNAIIEACVFQTCTASLHHRPNSELEKGALVYLSTTNLNLPIGRARKLCPKWVEPHRILQAYNETSNYLPMVLQKQRIYSKFHVLLLWPYKASNNVLFPNRATPEPYNFGAPDNQEWFVNDLLSHCWDGVNLKFEVCWSLENTTLESLATCKNLKALNRYLELQSI